MLDDQLIKYFFSVNFDSRTPKYGYGMVQIIEFNYR